MFGFFSLKQQPAVNASNLQSDAMAINSEPQQLRTPSPSEAAFNNGPVGPAVNANVTVSSPSAPAVPPTPEALHSLVTTIPAKTLHSYVLAHIPTAPPDTLVSLASFFATLAPPPLLHCVRCHVDYTEIENDDRSCRVPHDDDSAEVEWIGSRGKYEYETYYGCCSRTVEGEGDLGPPDGWCYEGMHTTDTKRARFRADSTLADDKLVTCLELNCHNIRSRVQSAKAGTSTSPRRAKRARPPPGESDIADDDGASAGTEDTGIAEIAQGVGALGQKGKDKGKAKVRTKQPKAAAAAAPASTSKPARARRVRVQAPDEPESDDGNGNNAGGVSAPAPAPAARQRGRPPRPRLGPDAKSRSSASSAGKVPAAAVAAAASPPSSPNSRGRKPPSVSKMDSVEIIMRSPSRSRTRSRVRGSGAETGEEKTMTDSEGKVWKRRKVAPAATA